MKQIKTLLIAAILMLGANQTINAQAKTAHVDVSEIMTKMPAMLDAQKQLEKLSTTYDADYKKMVEEYQAKLKKYEAEAATVTEAINGDRSKEVETRDERQKLVFRVKLRLTDPGSVPQAKPGMPGAGYVRTADVPWPANLQ